MDDVLLALNFIWEFLKPVGTGLFQDRLKQKPSTEVARKKVLSLYHCLQECSKSVDNFISVLEGYCVFHEQVVDVDGLIALTKRGAVVEEQCQTVVHSLVHLTDSLTALDPQLGIHKPELVALLDNFLIREALAADFVERDIWPSEHTTEAEREVLAQARHNRDLLAKAVGDFRGFIAKEFAFKEMF